MNDSPSLEFATGPGVPGTTGTPTFMAMIAIVKVKITAQRLNVNNSPKVLAFVLSPKPSITSGEGPTKARPASSTFLANSAFSDKKP